jgi:hypothetical protein
VLGLNRAGIAPRAAPYQLPSLTDDRPASLCSHSDGTDSSFVELSQSWCASSASLSYGWHAFSVRADSCSERAMSSQNAATHTTSDAKASDKSHQGLPTLTNTSALSSHTEPDSMSARLLAAIDGHVDSQALFAGSYVFVPGAAEGSQSYVQFARRCAAPASLHTCFVCHCVPK